MADDLIKLDSVDEYNRLFGLETLHPLVNVIDLKEATRFPTHFTINYGVYAIFLKDLKCGDIRYGRQKYDYQDGTIVCFAPGQVAETEMLEGVKPMARGLLFHPDLIKGTSLGREMHQYTFFSYNSSEALHLSETEKETMLDCLKNIKKELVRPIDQLSKRLIAQNIQLMLDYCMRFYNRQFITRRVANSDVLSKFEALLDDYFNSAEHVYLSANYFGDLIKKETGRTAQEYIQAKIMDRAKEQLLGTDKTVSQIADELGFQYSQHFNRIFKKITGLTPNEYRRVKA